MPLKKIVFKPGVNKENTRYTTEGGWYDCDKIRFRQGTPEKIGGWVQASFSTFVGVCRTLWAWVTLASRKLVGVGTNLKFYISDGGAYYDITPVTSSNLLGANPFSVTSGSPTVTVTDASASAVVEQYVIFSGASTVAGINMNGEFRIVTSTGTSYTVLASNNASSTTTGGGSVVYAAYELAPGPAYTVPNNGWGSGAWGSGSWGTGVTTADVIRLWSQNNFGEDLIFGPRGKPMYYWKASLGYLPSAVTFTIASPAVATFTVPITNGAAVMFTTTSALPTGLTPNTVYYTINASGYTANLATTADGTAITTTGSQSGTHYLSPRAIPLSSIAYAADVPLQQNYLFVSDISRFVFAFGSNAWGSTTPDPMLVRWSDQESAAVWTPLSTNQAGSVRLSHGSKIVTAQQSRQELLVFTDSTLYSLQYVGTPVVWSTQLVGDNVSIVSENATAYANGVTYWMGVDKFYKYSGSVDTLRCDLRQYIFNDINSQQYDQVYAGTNEGFNEVWWFYCSSSSNVIDKYVIYNYLEDTWYYGTMGRTAWLDSGILTSPLAATYSNNLVYHEVGTDDGTLPNALPIDAYITSSEFDIDDGHNFSFIYRLLPDITFRGSSATSPQAIMTLYPLANSGSGYNNPYSEGGVNYGAVTRIAQVPVETFTGQVFIRVRGRQLAFKVESTNLGVQWQLGAPRIDIRPDGRRGNT